MRTPIIVCLILVGCGQEVSRREPTIVSQEAELRPTDSSTPQMWRFLPTDTVESYGIDGGSFKVHFTRTALNGVPAGDANTNGVPDFVEQVDQVYEAVGDNYAALGFRRPLGDGTLSNNGGDSRFDVYLLDFGRSADGAFRVDQCLSGMPERCAGYVVQENDFAGYGYPSAIAATRILGSHEYFHGVQAAYNNNQNVVLLEGTAVWATEHFDPSTRDFENFIDGYLNLPDRSIDSPPPGPVPSYAYGSAIFFKFLTERHDDALLRKLWEHLETGHGDPSEPGDQQNPTWVIQLDALLKRDYQSSFSAEFAEFARWNLYMNTAADSAQAWDDASQYPSVAMSTVSAPHAAEAPRIYYASTQYFSAPAAGRTAMTAALVDSPLTPGNDLDGLVMWAVARRGGRNVEVVKVTAGQTVNATNGTFILAVVNTNRGANGSLLAQRPNICLGTPEEVASCVAGFNGTVDAGVDAGQESIDAGAEVPDGGTPSQQQPPPPCGCGLGSGPLMLLALPLVWAVRRRTWEQ